MDKTNVLKISSDLLEASSYALRAEIAKKFDMDWNSINKIFKGEWTNEEVMNFAIQSIKDHRTKMDKVLKKVEKIKKRDQAA